MTPQATNQSSACKSVCWLIGLGAGGYLAFTLTTTFKLDQVQSAIYGIVTMLLVGLAMRRVFCRGDKSRVQMRVEQARAAAAETTTSARKTASNPVASPAASSAVKSAVKSTVRPTARPVVKPAVMPASKPIDGPDGAALARKVSDKVNQAANSVASGDVLAPKKPTITESAAAGSVMPTKPTSASASASTPSSARQSSSHSPLPLDASQKVSAATSRAPLKMTGATNSSDSAASPIKSTDNFKTIATPTLAGDGSSELPRVTAGDAVQSNDETSASEPSAPATATGSKSTPEPTEPEKPGPAIKPMKPKGITLSDDTTPDDLSQLDGVSDDVQAALNRNGVFMLQQFVSMNRRELCGSMRISTVPKKPVLRKNGASRRLRLAEIRRDVTKRNLRPSGKSRARGTMKRAIDIRTQRSSAASEQRPFGVVAIDYCNDLGAPGKRPVFGWDLVQ